MVHRSKMKSIYCDVYYEWPPLMEVLLFSKPNQWAYMTMRVCVQQHLSNDSTSPFIAHHTEKLHSYVIEGKKVYEKKNPPFTATISAVAAIT